MSNLSDDAIQALTATETNTVFLYILRLLVDGIETFCAVNNNQSVVSNGITYNPVAFSITLPSQTTDGGAGAAKLSIDNTDRAIMQLVTEAIGKRITAEVSIILASTPDIIERGPLRLILRNVTATKQTVSGELYDFYLFDRIIPEGRYTPKDFPGLF